MCDRNVIFFVLTKLSHEKIHHSSLTKYFVFYKKNDIQIILNISKKICLKYVLRTFEKVEHFEFPLFYQLDVIVQFSWKDNYIFCKYIFHWKDFG